MNCLLVPIDGSENSLRVVQRLVEKGLLYGVPGQAEVHLLNVQHPFTGNVGMFISQEQMRNAHQEEGIKALAEARQLLDRAGVKYSTHIGVGDPAEVIAQYAKEQGCAQIMMGTRGLGRVAGLLLGSVAQKVIHLSEVPVLLVK